jgi:hypothetical protein
MPPPSSISDPNKMRECFAEANNPDVATMLRLLDGVFYNNNVVNYENAIENTLKKVSFNIIERRVENLILYGINKRNFIMACIIILLGTEANIRLDDMMKFNDAEKSLLNFLNNEGNVTYLERKNVLNMLQNMVECVQNAKKSNTHHRFYRELDFFISDVIDDTFY